MMKHGPNMNTFEKVEKKLDLRLHLALASTVLIDVFNHLPSGALDPTWTFLQGMVLREKKRNNIISLVPSF